ncbi:Uncharacterized protein OBRU01_24082 [Operophtera brumata]|uniref:Uncharacterized protein n=1 Tax=Operophtera brumata TaxID=104452 RepID=A0A0L7KMX7_OPEBR|nr:Uncharacterized protein OBRU01_24082 [Operophtera brumata]
MVDQMTAILNPNPQKDTPELIFRWPAMRNATRQYLRVDDPFSLREKLFEERFHVWERLYRPQNCAYCTN